MLANKLSKTDDKHIDIFFVYCYRKVVIIYQYQNYGSQKYS